MRRSASISNASLSAALLGVALLAALGGGCRAGPPPEDFPPPEPRESGAGLVGEASLAGELDSSGETDLGWTEAVDGFVFGSAAAPSAFGPGGAGPGGSAGPVRGRAGGDGTGTRTGTADSLAARAARAVEEDRLEEAAELLETAIQAALLAGASPEEVPSEAALVYRRAFADLLLALGRDAEAAEAYRSLLGSRTARGSAAVHGNLAVALLRGGDIAGAREACAEALRVDPAYPEAKKTLGLADIREGRIEEGRARLLDAIGSGRTIPEAERALAELEEREGDIRGALERTRKLLDACEREEPRDRHRRWKNLFRPLDVETGEELRRRIERLEALLAEPAGPGEPPGTDLNETQG